jgi:hypothetical protein
MATTTDPKVAQYLELINDQTEWIMPDIGRELNVKPQTVRSWRKDSLAAMRKNPAAPPHPHQLPPADVPNTHGRPVWRAGTIRKWAMQTGRMSESGVPQRLKPPGRPRGTTVALAA